MASLTPGIEARLARTQGVAAVRRATAVRIGDAARAELAQHRDTGSAAIVVEHGRTDSLVILEDKASISLEYGRDGYTRSDGTYVGPMDGLRILRNALAAST